MTTAQKIKKMTMEEKIKDLYQILKNGDGGFPHDLPLPHGWEIDTYEKEDVDFTNEAMGLHVWAQIWCDFGQIVEVKPLHEYLDDIL